MKSRYLIFLVIFAISIIKIAVADDVIKVDLYIKDHKFVPDIVELPTDKKICLIVHNDDPTIEEFESSDLKREKIVLGNSTVNILLAPLSPGEYRFFGDFHQETAQGKIIVKKEE